jgi:hypothetical protein
MSDNNIARRIFEAWPPRVPFAELDGKEVGRPTDDIEKLIPQIKKMRQVHTIVEVGGELGGSTRFFLKAFPEAIVVTIDPWGERYGHVAKKWPDVAEFAKDDKYSYYRVFLSLNWSWRNRLWPMRATSGEGFPELFKAGLKPDLIYLDGLHTYHGCYDDLALSHFLFPEALICGDDWVFRPGAGAPHFLGFELPVQSAVVDFAKTHGDLQVIVEGNSYIIGQPK